MGVIKKGDVLGLKKWITDLIITSGEFHFSQCSYYEDYKYVDDVIFSIIKEFDDLVEGISNGVEFETIAKDINDKIVVSDISISIFAYSGSIRTPIPVTSGQHSGIIRTVFRQHPDTLSS